MFCRCEVSLIIDSIDKVFSSLSFFFFSIFFLFLKNLSIFFLSFLSFHPPYLKARQPLECGTQMSPSYSVGTLPDLINNDTRHWYPTLSRVNDPTLSRENACWSERVNATLESFSHTVLEGGSELVMRHFKSVHLCLSYCYGNTPVFDFALSN